MSKITEQRNKNEDVNMTGRISRSVIGVEVLVSRAVDDIDCKDPTELVN